MGHHIEGSDIDVGAGGDGHRGHCDGTEEGQSAFTILEKKEKITKNLITVIIVIALLLVFKILIIFNHFGFYSPPLAA